VASAASSGSRPKKSSHASGIVSPSVSVSCAAIPAAWRSSDDPEGSTEHVMATTATANGRNHRRNLAVRSNGTPVAVSWEELFRMILSCGQGNDVE